MKVSFLRLFFIACLFANLSLPLYGKLQQVFHIARHGARTPSSFEFKPAQYLEGAGELTILGKIQQYYLGQEMRKRYIDEETLISENYNPSQVVIKSSGKPRVIASALAFVNGLYPQPNGQVHENIYAEVSTFETLLPLTKRLHNINIDKIETITLNEDSARNIMTIMPMEGDLFFHADQGDRCPVVKQRINELKQSPAIIKLEEEYRNKVYPHLVEIINRALGNNKLSITDLNIQTAKRILDNYRCNTFHNVERPDFNATVLDLLLEVRYNFIYEILYKDEFVKAVAATRLLEDIRNYIELTKQGLEAPKFIFYAAHDHNIEALLSLLLEESLLVDKKYYMIEFASVLSIEVHQEEKDDENSLEEEKNYVIKFFYNDEPLPIKWCEHNTCSVEQFTDFVERFVVPNLEEVCGN